MRYWRECFTASTRVLLASGAAVPISQLKPGEKVLATNTKTGGKTQAETVTAVLVHHDTDLYDLKIRDHGKTAVIDTNSNHLFWVPGTRTQGGRWIKAGARRYGTRLRTPSGSNATVVGGYVPRQHDGWMWDLTVPGNNDHDFYVDTSAANILVHNSCGSTDGVTDSSGYTWAVDNPDTSVLEPGEAWDPSQGTPVIGRLPDTQQAKASGSPASPCGTGA